MLNSDENVPTTEDPPI